MASWTHEEEMTLVTSVVDAMKGRPPGQTKYWVEAFAAYRHNVGNDRHNPTRANINGASYGPSSTVSRLTTKRFRAAS
ncbi:hypothetical protein HanIR_Chr14g0704591 [Helianthus annuus]|nr:hypothetical protein HanIR_Chr14g0704591 [Helianthus annuus]